MKYLIVVLIAVFSGCQIKSKEKHRKEENSETHQVGSKAVENSGNLTFSNYIETIPEVKFPIKYQDYEKLFIPCQGQNCNILCIDKEQIKGMQLFYIKRFDFDEIQNCYGSNSIPDQDEFKFGPQGGKFEAELGVTCPIFHCKNDNLILIGYLSEWWIRSEGGDFYEPRAQLDIVVYDIEGGIVLGNFRKSEDSGMPKNQLIVNLPDFNGCREIRANIISWQSIVVRENVIQEYEIRLSENGLDEEYVEYEEPKIMHKETSYSISTNGIVSENHPK